MQRQQAQARTGRAMTHDQLSVNHGPRRRSKAATASYRRFYDLAPDMFAIIDAKTARVLDCNRALTAATGYAKRELVGRDVFDLYHPDDLEHARQVSREFVKSGKVHDVELPLRHRDGHGIDVSISVSVGSLHSDGRVAREAFPEIEQAFQLVMERLQQAPREVTLPDPLTAETRSARLTAGELAGAVRLLSYSAETAALLPLLIYQAYETDNYAPIAAQALLAGQSISEALSLGMHNAVVCTEDVPFYDQSRIDRQALAGTYLGVTQLDVLQQICSIWPAGVLDTDFNSPVDSDKPALVLSGEADPVTPPANGDRVAAALTNSKHLVGPSQGHGLAPIGCVPQLMERFVESASVEELEVECLTEHEPAPFFTSFVGPEP